MYVIWKGVVKAVPIKDSLLVKRSRAGELGAFDELVKRYENKVYTLAYRYIGNHNDANDMARAAFIRAYQSLSTCGGNTGFATWLYKITVNTCLDANRKDNKHNDLSLDKLMTQPKGTPSSAISEPSPEKCLAQSQLKDAVHKVLITLSGEYRMVLILKEILGLNYSEMAYCLGWPENIVKSKLHRARQALKEKIMAKRELTG